MKNQNLPTAFAHASTAKVLWKRALAELRHWKEFVCPLFALGLFTTLLNNAKPPPDKVETLSCGGKKLV